ncbi:MAG: hypothetical protein ABIG46_03675 [Candidatus Omnitrophota bacterium]|nr:hypothetical protein [Candidatus Omnitrophota bacterium]
MNRLIYFSPVVIPIPRTDIYKRLGYRQGITRVSSGRIKDTNRIIKEAAALIKLKAMACILTIRKVEPPRIYLSQSIAFNSRQVCDFLKGYSEVLFMGVTAGRKITQAIGKELKNNRFNEAVIMDAVASEMVDSSLGWVMRQMAKKLKNEKKTLSDRRFSAGYADFTLDNQRTIYRLLQLKRLGVSINKGFILIPEKSVTALSGIKVN